MLNSLVIAAAGSILAALGSVTAVQTALDTARANQIAANWPTLEQVPPSSVRLTGPKLVVRVEQGSWTLLDDGRLPWMIRATCQGLVEGGLLDQVRTVSFRTSATSQVEFTDIANCPAIALADDDQVREALGGR
ncbi:MAG: hypothetical protein ACFB2Z_04350 [Maricaulaceae bacterium]